MIRKPAIAAINGHAIGIGLTLALQCDTRIISREGKYGILRKTQAQLETQREAGLARIARGLTSRTMHRRCDMPLFMYRGHDSNRGAELRKQHRDEHLAHLEPLDAAGRIYFAGPLIDESGSPAGSLILFEAADLDEATKIAENDPYLTHGIFESVEVHATKKVFPRSGSSDSG